MREKVLAVLADFNDEILDDLEQDLLATEILDSFEIVKLVVELEDAFDITIDVDQVTPDNFRKVESIIAMIEKIALA